MKKQKTKNQIAKKTVTDLLDMLGKIAMSITGGIGLRTIYQYSFNNIIISESMFLIGTILYIMYFTIGKK